MHPPRANPTARTKSCGVPPDPAVSRRLRADSGQILNASRLLFRSLSCAVGSGSSTDVSARPYSRVGLSAGSADVRRRGYTVGYIRRYLDRMD